MLQRTLSANPDERPSASEIVEMLDAEGGPTMGRLSDWLGRRSRLQQLFLLLMAITILGIIGLLLAPRAADDVTAILLKLLKSSSATSSKGHPCGILRRRTACEAHRRGGGRAVARSSALARSAIAKWTACSFAPTSAASPTK